MAAPALGRAIRDQWPLDPSVTYLNHGTVGVTPRIVMAAQAALREEIERQPARFLLRELTPIGVQGEAGGESSHEFAEARPQHRLRRAANAVGPRLGVTGDDLVFLDNATTGANAVLASWKLSPGDHVLVTSQAYGAVARAAAFHANRARASVVTAKLPFPYRNDEQILDALERAITPRTRLAVLEHIAPETAVVMPLAEMARVCRDRGVAVLVDGAHAPAAIPVDIASYGVDAYTANLHKWAFAPRGCAILWLAAPHRRHVHPLVMSWGSGLGWHAEFDWPGTRDPTPFLCAPAGFQFIDDVLGGTDHLWAHNHELARRSAERLTARWGIEWALPRHRSGSMITFPLPLSLGGSVEEAAALKDWLLFERNIEAQPIAIEGTPCLRLCAQAYVDDEDVERLASAIAERL